MPKLDSKLSWVVCFGSFVVNILTLGFSYSISVYYVEFLAVFNESKGTTAWVSSLNFGMLCFAGPFGSLMIHRWGSRVTMFIGGILSALGLFICSFATQFYMVLLSFGIVAGIGAGLAITAAVVALNIYFEKYRPIALGLSLSGAGIGNIFYPWVTSTLIEQFGWRGTLLLSSAISLHMCVSAMLILKDDTTEVTKKKSTSKMKLDKTGKQTDTSNNEIESVKIYHINMTTAYQGPNTSNEKSYVKIELNNIETKPMEENKSSRAEITDEKSGMNNAKLGIWRQKRILFKDPSFILLLLNTLILMFGVGVFLTHILAYVESKGIPASTGNLLLTVIGATNVAGRIILNGLCQLEWTNAFLIHTCAVLFCGLAMFSLALWTSTVGLHLSCSVFGLFSAAFGPLLVECTALISGKVLFNFAYGYVMVMQGVGWLLGAPAAGMMFDFTEHYPNSFYLGGAVTISGTFLMLPIILFQRKKEMAKKTVSRKAIQN